VTRDRVDILVQRDGGHWLSFADPARLVEARRPEEVRPAIAEVERLTRDAGYHAAGFLSYEAGAAFGLSARSPRDTDVPLAWFALFEPSHVREVEALESGEVYELGPLAPSLDRAAFDAAFRRIKGHLADGDTYQVNFTFRMSGSFYGDARSLFADLVQAQQGRHSAFVDIGSHVICSASPELFFALDGLDVSSRPMKGTAKRGPTLAEDRRRRDELQNSSKQRAENVMIVDMVRNDLGRIAEIGSVHVPELFTVEPYPNVWQMTSLVTARSRASLEEVFAAMHPSASVTGAPKVRTMELLNELEGEPRGVYAGAIGHVSPDGNARFNVAIRTAVVNVAQGRVDFGVGSGIVWDSDPAAEYDECLLKGSVLGRRPVAFELLETTRWRPGEGFLLLERHLGRLRDSAEYFGFPCSLDAVRAAMQDAVAPVQGSAQRVRVMLGRDAAVRVECLALPPASTSLSVPLRVGLAASPIDSDDPFVFHKTTNRAHYDRARISGLDDVILWNSMREVTEATTANIVVELTPGDRVTPPVACGLLAGTCRAEALAEGWMREAVVTIDQLRSARTIWLLNSVYERREAVLSETTE
jgi:para-aminobenzoate synthetase / 4-amino-4-deoxychorismate lyase